MSAAAVTIHIRTVRKPVNGGIPRIQRNVKANSNRAAYNFARSVQAGARRRVHVITGRLKASIERFRLGPGHHKVIVGMYYGVYEEYGTRYRPPHPYFRPAVAAAKAQFMREMKGVFR